MATSKLVALRQDGEATCAQAGYAWKTADDDVDSMYNPVMRNLMLILFALAALVAGMLSFEAPFVAQDDNAEEELTEEEKTALATKAYFILRNNCWGCHGEPGKEHYGETTPLDWILDYDKLVKHKVVVPGEPGKSRLIRIILTDDMPRAFDEQGKPSKRTDLAEGELETLIEWIKAGAPEWSEFEYTHEWVRLGDAPFGPVENEGISPIAFYPGHDGQPLLVWENDQGLLEAASFADGRWEPRVWSNERREPAYSAWDSKRNRMVGLFVPKDEETSGYEVMVSDGTGWQESEIERFPNNQSSGRFIYDPTNDRFILHGGVIYPRKIRGTTFIPPTDATWVLKEDKWKRLEQKDGPGKNDVVGMTYDPVSKQTVMMKLKTKPEPSKTEVPRIPMRREETHRTWKLTGNKWTPVEEEPWQSINWVSGGTTVDVRGNHLLWEPTMQKPVLVFDVLEGGRSYRMEDQSWKPIAYVPFHRSRWLRAYTDTKGGRLVALNMQSQDELHRFETWALIPWRKAEETD